MKPEWKKYMKLRSEGREIENNLVVVSKTQVRIRKLVK